MTDIKKEPDSKSEEGIDSLGDMSAEEFRRYGYQVIDWIAEYLDHPERYPVLSKSRPGDLKKALPQSAPVKGEEMAEVLADLERLVVPGVTHWNHPAFFAYFSISSSGPGILGEIFSAAFNVNAMLWKTSPSATELEEVTIDWTRKMMGLPPDFSGVIYDTASISTLCAIAAAREAVPGQPIREEGVAGAWAEAANSAAPPPKRLRLYASEHVHSSVDKAAIILGIGQAGVRKIPSDEQFRMDARALEAAIKEDKENGWLPFCVVATVGTTSITSIDPVPEIAGICKREKIWLHVDGAYGGSIAVVPEMRWILDGCEHADSIVVNPHKWLFVPLDLSILYCKRMDVLRQAFSLIPEYLRTGESEEVRNFMDYGPQLGRRFRAIKLWFVLRYFGSDGIAARIRHHLGLARDFAELVDGSPDFERLAPVPFSLVCFRARPASMVETGASEGMLDSLNEELMDRVNGRGKIFFSHTKLKGKFTLRLAIGNIRTTREHIDLAWNELNEALGELSKGEGFSKTRS
ncbi:MAG TPA: pyridoxal-dependent decarboxylase [Blastocatellia bacterium]|nr:pyridoxal-dependent decarboxylase [Blastocatellia bacterium]